jgi:WD40-like Beta Propeller Repeat
VGASCSDAPSGPNPPSPTPAPARSLLYLDGTELHRIDVASRQDDVLVDLGSADAVVAPDSSRVAYVKAAPFGGGEDFVARPDLMVLDLATQSALRVGAGLSPLWRPDGEALAYLKPVEARACDAEVCGGRSRVVVAELPGPSRSLAPPGRYGLLAWGGSRLYASDLDEVSHALAFEAGTSPEKLPLPPSEFWGASPNGRWLVSTPGSSVNLVSLDGGGVSSGDPLTVELGGLRLAEGAWAPGSDRVAAVVFDPKRSGPKSAKVVLFGPDDPRPTSLPGSAGAAGEVTWSPDGETLAYARAQGGKLAAVVCSEVPTGPCRSLFTWRQGVSLLGIAP